MKKRFKEKIGDKTIILGLNSLAVLLVLVDAISNVFLTFPDRHTSLHKVLRQLKKNSPKSINDYFTELKEISGFNLRNTLYRLEQKGLISRIGKKHKITAFGRKFVENVKNKINSSENWDGKWRLITFDIPEKKRFHRDWLRYVLKDYDYKQLHKSVFLGKFALPEEIYREIYKRKLTDYVKLLTVGEMDEDNTFSSFHSRS